jgi:hypothetical protein
MPYEWRYGGNTRDSAAMPEQIDMRNMKKAFFFRRIQIVPMADGAFNGFRLLQKPLGIPFKDIPFIGKI